MLLQILIVNANSHTPLPEDINLSEKAERILAQEINNRNLYDQESPLLQEQYQYPVIFEPIRHIKLSRSTYKVISFIDFTPHIRMFESFEQYLNDLTNDMNNTNRLGALQYIQESFKEDYDKTYAKGRQPELVKRLLDLKDNCDYDIGKACKEVTEFVNECYSMVKNMCNIKRRYRKMMSIVKYIREDFLRTKSHFLKAIDHVQEQTIDRNNTERRKRSVNKEQMIEEAYNQIDYNEKELLEEIFDKLGSVDLETGKRQTRQKRFGIMNWIMGWGIFSNLRNIKQIKRNIRTLYHQNLLQEKQIHDLAHYLNLTATHVQLQGKMINEIQTRLAQIDFQLINLHRKIDYHMHVNGLMQEMGTAVHRLLAGLIAIRNNVEKVYDYMWVMATQKVHPALLPPDPLRELLRHVKNKNAGESTTGASLRPRPKHMEILRDNEGHTHHS